jgi:hypothetical protein
MFGVVCFDLMIGVFYLNWLHFHYGCLHFYPKFLHFYPNCQCFYPDWFLFDPDRFGFNPGRLNTALPAGGKKTIDVVVFRGFTHGETSKHDKNQTEGH